VRRLAAALLVAAVLAGCGGGLASPVALKNHATRICRVTGRAINPTSTPASPGQLTAFLTVGIRNLQSELGQLRGLHAPSGEVGAVYGAALRSLAAELSALRSAVVAIRRGQDPALAFRTLQEQLAPLEKQANGAWQALGIPACLER